ncbi:dCTP deaminase/dUTP pyrophosphatase [Halohasta litchfieldiae]|jgi:deoxycytidine triphosphate deaminase|uniref:dCTP deaminase/dUTP pyrophosphatase n=2 Tax=Halohasta litchfieldiae TaxID=1073996 RepID=A0A1H6RIU0_9EURY|nr:dCTP deaminase/dUTP pyrophosphatase [Halohasta litchfieldiae]SEI55673.1 dCTP deaminase/dUTP pyrophosphatase [Halohasta litchfieldiae]
MFESGALVGQHISPIADTQLQPNGVDLTAAKIYKQIGTGRIGRDGKEIGDREEVEPVDGTFTLEPGAYIVQYGETVHIPEEHIGFIYPRSSLMRNSCMLHTAVWDAGYEGKGEGLLEVHHEIEIEQGARIAQIVFAEADHDGTYDGSYQGENVD